MKDIINRVCDLLPRARPQQTPTASKGSNGRVEQCKRAVEGLARTTVGDLADRYGMSPPTRHPVVACAIRHTQMGPNGQHIAMRAKAHAAQHVR